MKVLCALLVASVIVPGYFYPVEDQPIQILWLQQVLATSIYCRWAWLFTRAMFKAKTSARPSQGSE